MRSQLRVLPPDWYPQPEDIAAPNLKLRVLIALGVLGTVAWVLTVWGIISLVQAVL